MVNKHRVSQGQAAHVRILVNGALSVFLYVPKREEQTLQKLDQNRPLSDFLMYI